MPSAGFKLAIPAIEELETYALNRMATGIGGTNHENKFSNKIIQACRYRILHSMTYPALFDHVTWKSMCHITE